MTPSRQRERALLVILLTLLGAIVVSVLVFLPRLQEVSQARREVGRKRAELARTVALRERGADIERSHAAAREAQQTLLVRIPHDPAVPELLARIGGLVDASGVQLLQISFGTSGTPAPTAAGLASVALQVQVRGSYARIRSFVTAVEDLPRAMAIDRLVLTGTEQGIVAELALRALYLPP